MKKHMTKVVYNVCYGGFGLSNEAMMRYAEIKGMTLYPETDGSYTTYWLKPEGERREDEYDCISDYDIDRADPVLAQVVEELGDKASGDFAKLRIAEVAEGTRYRIDEYDGMESVMTVDDYNWRTA